MLGRSTRVSLCLILLNISARLLDLVNLFFISLGFMLTAIATPAPVTTCETKETKLLSRTVPVPWILLILMDSGPSISGSSLLFFCLLTLSGVSPCSHLLLPIYSTDSSLLESNCVGRGNEAARNGYIEQSASRRGDSDFGRPVCHDGLENVIQGDGSSSEQD